MAVSGCECQCTVAVAALLAQEYPSCVFAIFRAAIPPTCVPQRTRSTSTSPSSTRTACRRTTPHALHSHVVRAATSCTAALLKEDFSTLPSRSLEPSGKWGEFPQAECRTSVPITIIKSIGNKKMQWILFLVCLVDMPKHQE